MRNKAVLNIFFVLVSLSLLATLFVSKDFLFPFITTKAFYFRILIELALPFYLYLIFSNKDLRPNLKNPLNILMLVFLAISLLSGIFGENIVRSLWGNFERMGGVFYLVHLTLLYFYVLLLGQSGGGYIKRFLQGLIGVSLIVTLNGIFGMLGGPTLVLDPSLPSRASSTLGNPIFFASFLILPMFFSLFFASQAEKKWSKVLYIFAALLQLIGILQSGTRGAAVGLVLGVFAAAVLFVILTQKQKYKNFAAGGILLFILTVALLFSFNQKLPQGSTLRRVFNLRDSNSNSRIIQWKIGIQGFKDHILLGTGPENYYVTGNKYYNSELYKYDRSWFDKPHNYLLEILITTGILGFLAYAGILLFSLHTLWRAFKAGFLSLFEAGLFFAGLLAYQIQNLFVFDTIPASLMFFAFLGFVAYLNFELLAFASNKKEKFRESKFPPGAVFAISGILVLVIVYIGNISPAMTAKNVNYGFAYAGADPKKSVEYFNRVLDAPFNFDRAESGNKYSDFAVSLVTGPMSGKDPEFVSVQLNKAIEYQKAITDGYWHNDPVALQRLANLYLYRAVFNKQAIPLEAVETMQRAIDLAPNRVEARLGLAQLRLYQGFPEDAVKIIEAAAALDLTNKLTKWQLALVNFDAGKTEVAVALAEELLAEGYEFKSSAEVSWLINYYIQTSQLNKAISLGEKGMEFENPSLNTAKALLGAYVAAGEKEKAQSLGDKLIGFDPNLAPEINAILGQ